MFGSYLICKTLWYIVPFVRGIERNKYIVPMVISTSYICFISMRHTENFNPSLAVQRRFQSYKLTIANKNGTGHFWANVHRYVRHSFSTSQTECCNWPFLQRLLCKVEFHDGLVYLCRLGPSLWPQTFFQTFIVNNGLEEHSKRKRAGGGSRIFSPM